MIDYGDGVVGTEVGYVSLMTYPPDEIEIEMPSNETMLSLDEALELGHQLIDMAMTMKGNNGNS